MSHIFLIFPFSFSTPIGRSNTYSPGMLQRIPPVNLSPTPSESDTSLTFDQREVIGGEDSECQSLTGKGEEEEEGEYPRHVRCYSKEDMKGVLYRTPVSGGNVSEEGEERGRKETKERARSYKLSVSLFIFIIIFHFQDIITIGSESSDDHRDIESDDQCPLDEPDGLSPTARR